MNNIQIERMEKINQLIELISREDVKLRPNASSYPFHSAELNRYSRFLKSLKGDKLFFFDKYTGKSIYPYPCSKWHGFSSGGTDRWLIETMRNWIIKGEPVDYGGLYVPYWGSFWTLESRQKLIDFGKEIGYIKPDSESYLDYLLSLPEYSLAYACDISEFRKKGRCEG